jgi:predicted dehydrogenase
LALQCGCAAFRSFEEMVESDQVDLVTIATPSGCHLEPALAAARAGKPALCEKPLETTLDRIDAMIAAHRKAGTLLGGIFQNRFGDAAAPLEEAVRAGRLGTITFAGVHVPWWRSDAYYSGSWRGTWKGDGGGALMNQAIHMVDLLCALMPPVESVQAYTATLGHEGIETEDTAAAVLRFETGALGVLYGTTASFPGRFKRLEITGTKGTIVLEEERFTEWRFAEEKPGDAAIRERFSRIEGGGGVSDPAAISHQNHARNIEAFLDALEEGGDFILKGEEARKAVEVVLAVYESARTNKPVRLQRPKLKPEPKPKAKTKPKPETTSATEPKGKPKPKPRAKSSRKR